MRRLVAFLVGWLALSTALAQTPNQNILRMNGGPSWILEGANIADLYFANGQYYTPGATGPQVNTRASAETCVDASSNWHQVASGQNCVTDLGVGDWEGRTNSNPNSVLAGATTGVIGSGGVYPTGFGCGFNSQPVTATIVLEGTESGLNYFDLNFSGTVTSYQLFCFFVGTTAVSETYGQTWTTSFFVRMSGGSSATVSGLQANLQGRTSGGGGGTDSFISANSTAPLSATVLGASRLSVSGTFAQSTGRYAWPLLYLNGNAGTLNITLRIAAQLLELNPLIPSSVATGAQTVTNSGTSTCVSGTYTVSGGTLASGGSAATLTGVASGGVITSLTELTPGSYTASGFPASPAALTGTGCSGSPTVTLTPANMAAKAFPTPPILTTNGAVARAADNISMPIRSCPSQISAWGQGTPSAPTGYSVAQPLWAVDGGSASNQLFGSRVLSTGAYQVGESIGGTTTTVTPSGTWAIATLAKLAGQASNNSLIGVANNGTKATASPSGFASGLTTLRIGVNAAGNNLNGVISRIAVACGRSLLND